MSDYKEAMQRVVEDFEFDDIHHYCKFIEGLSGAKIRIRKHVDYLDENDWPTDEDKAVDSIASIRVLFTDGDGGAMVFSFSEMYEDEGVQIELVACQWCDITFDYMTEVQEIFEMPELYANKQVVVLEKPLLTESWDSDEPSPRLIKAKKDRENYLANRH